MMLNVTDVLTQSLKLVKKKWTKGSYFSDGAMCAAGAVAVAMGRAPGAAPSSRLEPYSTNEGLAKGDFLSEDRAVRLLAICMTREAKRIGLSLDDLKPVGKEKWLGTVTHINDSDGFKKSNVINALRSAIKYAARRHYDGK